MGGLAAAIRLARAGVGVQLLERAPRVGGKLRELVVPGPEGARAFDAGPSVLTLRWVFEELLDGPLEAHLALVPLDPLCRHFFADGSVLDLFGDEERSAAAIAAFAGPREADGYRALRKKARVIYDIVLENFLLRAQPSLLGMLRPGVLRGMAQLDAGTSLWQKLSGYFSDPRLRQLFGRYATYNGSDPFRAPATLQVIVHVENALGVWACPDGLYRLADALVATARGLGVEIETDCGADRIVIEHDRVVGVEARGRLHRADVVVANCDAATLYEDLLPEQFGGALGRRYDRAERSLSAYVLLAHLPTSRLPLVHHNVFFSRDYELEFDELRKGHSPEDPTVYLCAQDRVSGTPTGASERCFLLSNSPPTSAGIDWESEGPRARRRILARLGRQGRPVTPLGERAVTPTQFGADFPGSRGALYGLSSNSAFAAFRRPTNRVAGVYGLYAASGSVHPGAGLPLVALSARIAVDAALDDLRVARP